MDLSPAAGALDVPLFRQEHPLSCEAAALRMALAMLGTHVTETELLLHLARDPTQRRIRPDGMLEWGDPDRGFVGAWDGVFARDGYGVYDGPIADLARAYGFVGTTHQRGADPAALYSAVRAGVPVVVWMPYDGVVQGRGAWITPEGKQVDYVVTEHAVVLAAVDGGGVSYADPYTATIKRATFANFEAAMHELDMRAVIVRD